jgi:N-formylglutamate amidohydrolase
MNHAILHIPHAGLELPGEYLGKVLIPDQAAFRLKVFGEADMYADQLFNAGGDIQTIQPSSARHVCDMERFRNDADEPESGRGRGLFYTRFENGEQFRENDQQLRRKVLAELYDRHHQKFAEAVNERLGEYGRCLIIDCHSFSDKPGHPDICLGTDPYHTPEVMLKRLKSFIEQAGYGVKVNFPYGGSIVPMEHYHKNRRVSSIMIEINKRLYMNEETFQKRDNFDDIRQSCRDMLRLLLQ